MSSLHLVTGYAGKEHVTSADQGSFHANLLLNGSYVLNVGNKFAATIVSNNSIKIQDGAIYMQGRYIKLDSGAFIDVLIENGTQDSKRNDLIVVRYTKDASTGIEGASLVAIKGTPDKTEAVDPSYTIADILDGALVCDMPLYRVPIDGLNVGELVPLFEVIESFDARVNAIIDDMEDIKEDLANCLPLGGGILTDTLRIFSSNDYPLIMKKEGTGSCYVAYVTTDENDGTVALGRLGFDVPNKPTFRNTSLVSYELHHDGNKPIGTYTGNGISTERQIATGGIGRAISVIGSNGTSAIITNGAVAFGTSVTNVPKSQVGTPTSGATIFLKTTHEALNASGVEYTYQVL